MAVGDERSSLLQNGLKYGRKKVLQYRPTARLLGCLRATKRKTTLLRESHFMRLLMIKIAITKGTPLRESREAEY